MNKKSLSTFLFSALLALALLGGSATSVSAVAPRASQDITQQDTWLSDAGFQNSGKITTYITFNRPPDANLGEPFTFSGLIKDQYGRPVANKIITFNIGDEYLGQARSNETGLFERRFTKDLTAGSYKVKATSSETHSLYTSVGYATLKILPAEVRVQTIPAIAGIPFQLDGKQFVSGEDGFATVHIDKPGHYRLEVLADQYKNPDKHIEFARWLEEVYQPYKDISVPDDKVIQAGFNVYHKVGQTFFDLANKPIDPKRVEEFTIRSAQGDMFVLHDGEPRWIPASRVARRAFGLEETKLLYSVLTVKVDGSNVVNQNQQKFYTYPVENWPISLLLYSLRVSAQDGLLGTPVGKSVNVQYPDGHVFNFPLEKDGTIAILSLARGNYTIELVGTNGLSNRIPVALSRNQDVSTRVITYLDLGIAGFTGLFLAIGLFLYGRRSMFFKKKQPVDVNIETEPDLLPEGLDVTQPSQNKGFGNNDSLPESLETTQPTRIHDYRHIQYDTLKYMNDEAFHATTGIERHTFDKMAQLLEKEMAPNSKRGKLSSEDQILLSLAYLRDQRTDYEIAAVYGITEGTVNRIVNRVKSVLMNSSELELAEKNVFQADNPYKRLIAVEASEPFHAK